MEIERKLKEIRTNLEGTLFMQKYHGKVLESTIRDVKDAIKEIKTIEARLDIKKMLEVKNE